jgi:glycosyltransferase involved in cell wall biosynthesis
VAFVGRLVEEKGIEDLLRAVGLCAATTPDITALVVGEGQDRAQFEKSAVELGVADRVSFTGWVQPEHVASYLAAADVFVAPSRRAVDGWVEAQGLTIVEAMTAEVPVVATRVGGIVDVVVDGETGLLIDERSPEQLAAAIHRLAGDRGLADRVRDTARRLVTGRYSRRVAAERFSDVLTGLVGPRSP